MMAGSPEAVVRRFLASWATGSIDAVMAELASECRFVNGSVGVTEGAAAIRAQFAPFLRDGRSARFEEVVLAVAPDGRTVLNERVDTLDGPAGRVVVPVAGAIVVEDGLIVEIRDYFDFAAVQAQR